MRKILSKEETEKREKKRVRIFSFILLVIMLASVAGYAFLYNGSNSSDGGNNSINTSIDGLTQTGSSQWSFNFGSQVLTFSSSPDSIKNVDVNITADLNQYYNQPLYIASNNQGMYDEINSDLGKYASRTQKGCYLRCADLNLPERNCTSNIIMINESMDNGVTSKDNCVFIGGDMRAVDAFLYRIFDIKQKS